MSKHVIHATTRRQFLAAAAAVAAPLIVPAHVVRAQGAGAAQTPTPSNRLGFGFIGMGGQGMALLDAFLHSRQLTVLAACDVWASRRARAKDYVDRWYAAREPNLGYGGCATYNDFRELVARPDLDAIVIATPDHWHALQTIAAVKAGKDVYCEKPMSFCVAEGRAMVEAVQRYGRVFQLGTQQRSDPKFRFAAELVRNGRIGKLHTIRLGVPPARATTTHPPMPVPEGFDYDLWLGPAPQAPYTHDRMEPCPDPGWYFISDYSPGWIAGWGVHHVDSAQQGHGTDLTGPVEIEGRGVFPDDGLYDNAVTWHVEYRFADGVTMIDTDTGETPMGVRFEGDKGWVWVWRDGQIDAEPKSLLKETFGPDEMRLYHSKDQQQNFIDCIKSRHTAVSPAEAGHRSTSICHLGSMAMLLGRKLKWDPAAERFVNDDEANRRLSRTMRAPWRL